MEGSRIHCPEIPGHVRVRAPSLRMSLLAVDEVRELHGVLDEKDWGIVSDHIVITLLSIELNSKSSWIPVSV